MQGKVILIPLNDNDYKLAEEYGLTLKELVDYICDMKKMQDKN